MDEAGEINCPLETLVAVFICQAFGNYCGSEMYPNFNLSVALNTELRHLSHLGLYHVRVTCKALGGNMKSLEICSFLKAAVELLQASA